MGVVRLLDSAHTARPRYGSFDEEARIRRRDGARLGADRRQNALFVISFVFASLFMYAGGFLTAFFYLNAGEVPVVQAAAAQAARSPIAGPENTRAQTIAPQLGNREPGVGLGIVGPASATAEPVTPRAVAPEIAAARARVGAVTDAPGALVTGVPSISGGGASAIEGAEDEQPEMHGAFSVQAEPLTRRGGASNASNPESRATSQNAAQVASVSPVVGAGANKSAASTLTATSGVSNPALTLQFGAFGSRSNADNLIIRLTGLIDAPRIHTTTGSNGAALYHVLGGRYDSEAAAKRVAATLSAEHRLESLVRPAPKSRASDTAPDRAGDAG